MSAEDETRERVMDALREAGMARSWDSNLRTLADAVLDALGLEQVGWSGRWMTSANEVIACVVDEMSDPIDGAALEHGTRLFRMTLAPSHEEREYVHPLTEAALEAEDARWAAASHEETR